MERRIGTVSRGVRGPIIRKGDDLAKIVVESVVEAAKSENLEFRDRDVVAVTESVVARSQGNYASIDDIPLKELLAHSKLNEVPRKTLEMVELKDLSSYHISISEQLVLLFQLLLFL